MVLTRISHSCLLIELGTICNNIIWQPYCDLRVARTTAYLKAIMGVYGNHLQVWAHKAFMNPTVAGLRLCCSQTPEDRFSRVAAQIRVSPDAFIHVGIHVM